ncbi:MAG: hypothetical protein A2X13_04835 [Bacteroidetes bacterium GWC2_33_15]|nr:MAG: hypothetical protein A2X10_06680 [Bacteroidetes bacterium GWA2_33_15]OFX49849.1 MAG: hypothetical protein A2X13_04835 [Bacteroidetes bacterium GWC2_33_15]OFX65040.1 MAG: hypothetical protein A2X15_06755 [Bacteroidetes bacterium GWB2_32_14]OFX68998.1 MAG: hypothetical protein A2X14_13400 [Bacteroidetes bacterium GWD2_33_33]HAN18263.1 hypothetical protein [Bacteroidales bacterium]
MGKLYDLLLQDIRFEEGLNACMNCGVCTAICPAAEFYKYDPREIVDTIQTKDEEKTEALLKSETIWYCGQCMSCKTRCPRGNTPALVIMALRTLSQKLGYFTDSEKGRQQFAIKRTVGENILKYGYCVPTYAVDPKMHPEQGPIWEHIFNNIDDVMDRLGGNLKKKGSGALREIHQKNLDELDKIFEVTGGYKLYGEIENYSEKKAGEMGLEFKKEGIDNEYFRHVYTCNSDNHGK